MAAGGSAGGKVLLLGGGLLAACAVHAVEEEPGPPVALPSAFPSAEADSALEPAGAWWSELADARLEALLRAALARNLELAAADARVREARALRRQVRAARLPLVDAFASAGVAAGPEGGGAEAFEVGLSGSWQLDAFGGLGALERAALLEAAAAADDLEGVRLALSAEVADTYYVAVEQRLQLALLAEQVALDRTLLELTELRFAQGEASAVDVLQQRSQLAQTRSLVPPAQARLRAAENALDVLLGAPPDGLERTAAEAEELPGFPDLPLRVALEVPASLLVRRPDLRALQRRLVAADERIGSALADRLPRIVLTGSASLLAGEGEDGVLRSAFASLVQPLLDQGRLSAAVEERRAERAALLAEFGAAFLASMAEVEDLLYRERRQRERIEVLAERRGILAATVTEARFRYANGLTDYLPVLTAVSELQETERALLSARRELVAQRIALHLALGGGVPAVAVEELRS